MFLIRVRLTSLDITGLAALDQRRQLGLPDGTRLQTVSTGSYAREAPIPEAMARVYFTAQQLSDTIVVPLDFLTPDDVEESNIVGSMCLRANISAERLHELYRATKWWQAQQL